MWDLSSLTRDRTGVPCIGRQILNDWTAQEGFILLELRGRKSLLEVLTCPAAEPRGLSPASLAAPSRWPCASCALCRRRLHDGDPLLGADGVPGPAAGTGDTARREADPEAWPEKASPVCAIPRPSQEQPPRSTGGTRGVKHSLPCKVLFWEGDFLDAHLSDLAPSLICLLPTLPALQSMGYLQSEPSS